MVKIRNILCTMRQIERSVPEMDKHFAEDFTRHLLQTCTSKLETFCRKSKLNLVRPARSPRRSKVFIRTSMPFTYIKEKAGR